jgi:hypothetical protein
MMRMIVTRAGRHGRRREAEEDGTHFSNTAVPIDMAFF